MLYRPTFQTAQCFVAMGGGQPPEAFGLTPGIFQTEKGLAGMS